MENSASELLLSIRRSFDDWLPWSDVVGQIESRLSKQEHAFPERQDAYRYLQTRKWSEVDVPWILSGPAFSSLPVIDPAVLTYYLPAFLLAALEERCSLDFVEVLINNIAPPWRKNAKPQFQICIEVYSGEQLKAISRVLRFFGAEYSLSSGMRNRVIAIADELESRCCESAP